MYVWRAKLSRTRASAFASTGRTSYVFESESEYWPKPPCAIRTAT
jgi:hypothetical protein